MCELEFMWKNLETKEFRNNLEFVTSWGSAFTVCLQSRWPNFIVFSPQGARQNAAWALHILPDSSTPTEAHAETHKFSTSCTSPSAVIDISALDLFSLWSYVLCSSETDEGVTVTSSVNTQQNLTTNHADIQLDFFYFWKYYTSLSVFLRELLNSDNILSCLCESVCGLVSLWYSVYVLCYVFIVKSSFFFTFFTSENSGTCKLFVIITAMCP